MKKRVMLMAISIMLIIILYISKNFITNKRQEYIILQEKTYCTENIKNVSQETVEQERESKNACVYITTYGEKYHREYCRYLTHTKEEIELEKAKKWGYEPCKVCKP